MEERIIVYIGPRERTPGSRWGPKILPDNKYLCFDIDPSVQEEYNKLSLYDKRKVRFFVRSGKKTQLLDNSIDEVHIYNVFGDPEVRGLKEFMEESKRIIKSEGAIYIGENSPTQYSVWDILNIAAKQKLMHRFIVPDETKILNDKELKFYSKLVKMRFNVPQFSDEFVFGNLAEHCRGQCHKYNNKFDGMVQEYLDNLNFDSMKRTRERRWEYKEEELKKTEELIGTNYDTEYIKPYIVRFTK